MICVGSPGLGEPLRCFARQPVVYCAYVRETLPKSTISVIDALVDSYTYMPNSDTNRPAKISQFCQGSCEPCQTFPASKVKKKNMYCCAGLALVNISECCVGCGLSLPTVWRCAMIMNVGMLFDDFRQCSLVDITSREVGIPEV